MRFATPSTPAPTATEKPEKVASVPGKVLDLDDWKITLPIGPQDDATEVEQPDLASFVKRPFFRVNRDGTGVVFRAPAGGATTSGSDYPRSELREMTAGGTQEASWSNASGKHVMTITQAITDAPKVKSHVVAGQIHDAEDDVVDALTAEDFASDPRSGPDAPRNLAELLERLRQERRRGFALASEEVEVGLTSIGVPVRNVQGHLLAVINVSGPTPRIIDGVESTARLLASASAAVTKSLATGSRQFG